MKAFSIHRGPEMSQDRRRCVEHNSSLVDLMLIGDEYQSEVYATGIDVSEYTSYSEVLRLLLLSKEPNLLYLDTDCWLVEAPTFSCPGRSNQSNWAMYSGDNPDIFAKMLDEHKIRRHVYESVDQRALVICGAKVINAIHKWEIPWFRG